MSVFDDPAVKFQEKFNEAMANLTEKETKMYAEEPELFKKAKAACLNVGSRPVRVRKSGTSSHGTFVTGPVVAAKPAYFKYAARSVSVVFEVVIQTTHPVNGSKHDHVVYLRKLPA